MTSSSGQRGGNRRRVLTPKASVCSCGWCWQYGWLSLWAEPSEHPEGEKSYVQKESLTTAAAKLLYSLTLPLFAPEFGGEGG